MAVANSLLSEQIATKQPDESSQPQGSEECLARPEVRGKFIFIDGSKYWVRGVTYGTFAPDADGQQFPAPEVVESDLALMASNGLNTLRTYTVPPRWLLDIALRRGLRVMVGLPWEQHVAFLDDHAIQMRIEITVRNAVRECAGHPAILCYALGNEIPASIVRWHGRRAIESFLKRLYQIAKAQDPDGLFTYVNFPTTEYLQLPFLDFVCFNVYLETQEKLSAYLAKLQNIAGEKPLLMAEIGLDSLRNGEEAQAASLAWQVQTAFTAGCIGAFAFAWTDEWYRGGAEIDDWDFGLTTRDRKPKPALQAVRTAMTEIPFPADVEWPLVSVVVCSLNGEPTIRDTMEGLNDLAYPNFEVIVIDDGSTDKTAAIAGEYPFKLISTENRGLSNARNTGWQEAQGEIIAYIDDDAYPDPHWLHYLAYVFLNTDFVGVGGPNLAPPGDGRNADCVANAPGGPVQVLLTDTEAEHIPGCNMAFRRTALAEIDGFDPIYRAAGDDVDLCWRLQERGGVIGFAPAAVVWHHRRNSLHTYWKQQQGYGKAEALLEQKWPEKYNALGHLTWSGRLYGKGLTQTVDSRRWHVYQGSFGLAPFQSLYERQSSGWTSMPLMPEWYLLLAGLGIAALLAVVWPPLAVVWPVLAIAVALPIAQAVISASQAVFTSQPKTFLQRAYLYVTTAALHLVQPLARLIGRLRHGLTLWRGRHAKAGTDISIDCEAWRETWRDPGETLTEMLDKLRTDQQVAHSGGTFDHWDIQVRGGLLGTSRLLMATEEHGGGKQLLRFRIRPHISGMYWCGALLLLCVTVAAGIDKSWLVAGLAGAAALGLSLRLRRELQSASASIHDVLQNLAGHHAVSKQKDITAKNAAHDVRTV